MARSKLKKKTSQASVAMRVARKRYGEISRRKQRAGVSILATNKSARSQSIPKRFKKVFKDTYIDSIQSGIPTERAKAIASATAIEDSKDLIRRKSSLR